MKALSLTNGKMADVKVFCGQTKEQTDTRRNGQRTIRWAKNYMPPIHRCGGIKKKRLINLPSCESWIVPSTTALTKNSISGFVRDPPFLFFTIRSVIDTFPKRSRFRLPFAPNETILQICLQTRRIGEFFGDKNCLNIVRFEILKHETKMFFKRQISDYEPES